MKKKVAIIGTNGIPANYGGFETLAENLTFYLNDKVDFIVYCSSNAYKEKKNYHNGSKLIYLPFKANGIQSFIFDFVSTFHAWFKADILLVLGPSAGVILFLNKIFNKIVIVNHGGLNEWEREKYSKIERLYVKINHKIAAKFAHVNIADNNELRKSIYKTFKVDSHVIRYGGDHILKTHQNTDYLSQKYKFTNSEYYISVSRAQVDNNLHMLLEVFTELNNIKLVLISNWNVSEYGRELKQKYKNNSNIIMLDAIYDLNELNFLRINAKAYIHSHSRCGTAPSLVEAMFINIPIICFDVPTNRETTKEKAVYFSSNDELKEILIELEKTNTGNESLYSIALTEYKWEKISEEYLEIFENRI